MAKRNPFKENRYEIFYVLINSFLSGALFLLGAFVDGEISSKGLLIGVVIALSVFLTQFKKYWEEQETEYKRLSAFTFIY